VFLTNPILGRVARIVDSHSLAINVGTQHGLKKGMEFAVISDELEHITDPDTDEIIGEIPCVKLKVRVRDTFSTMSIATTYETYTTGGGINSGVADMFAPRVERRERIRTDDKLVAPEDWKVSVGDKVMQINDD